MFNLVSTAMSINNTCQLTTIPFHYLTRIEKPNHPLLPIHVLNYLSTTSQQDFFVPFQNTQQIDQLLLDYQSMCHTHIKSILTTNASHYIYVSMTHDKNNNYKNFYNNHYQHQFHYIFEYISCDDQVFVKPVYISNINIFLNHQELARQYEKQFNLIHQIQHYIHCPYCIPTLASTFLFYKEGNKIEPKMLSLVDDEFKKAFVLIKNDRINLNKLFSLTQIKWKIHYYDDYINKINNIGQKYKWDYYQIINHIHKIHYNTMKFYERSQDKKNNVNWNDTKCLQQKTNSPSWRSTNNVNNKL